MSISYMKKADLSIALPHWCNCTQRQNWALNCCKGYALQSVQVCVKQYIGLWSMRDDEVTLRVFQVAVVQTLAQVLKKVCFIGIQRLGEFSYQWAQALIERIGEVCSQTHFASLDRSFGVFRVTECVKVTTENQNNRCQAKLTSTSACRHPCTRLSLSP